MLYLVEWSICAVVLVCIGYTDADIITQSSRSRTFDRLGCLMKKTLTSTNWNGSRVDGIDSDQRESDDWKERGVEC